MKCPNCGLLDQNSKVIDSRPFKHTIKRRRECSNCHHRWNTYEATEIQFFSERNRNKYLPWSAAEEKTAMVMAFDGKTRIAIAEALGRSRSSVGRKLDKLVNTDRYYLIVNEELKKRRV
jgi:transcriptional regulator NrdR family protein